MYNFWKEKKEEEKPSGLLYSESHYNWNSILWASYDSNRYCMTFKLGNFETTSTPLRSWKFYNTQNNIEYDGSYNPHKLLTKFLR